MLPTIDLRDLAIIVAPDNPDPTAVREYRGQMLLRGDVLTEVRVECNETTAPAAFEFVQTTIYQQLTQRLFGR